MDEETMYNLLLDTWSKLSINGKMSTLGTAISSLRYEETQREKEEARKRRELLHLHAQMRKEQNSNDEVLGILSYQR